MATREQITVVVGNQWSRQQVMRGLSGLLVGTAFLGTGAGRVARTLAHQDHEAIVPLAEDEDGHYRAAELVEALEHVGWMDYDTGRVEVDSAALAEVLAAFLDPDAAARYGDQLERHARLGWAVAGGAAAVEAGQGVAVPWALVEEIVADEGESAPPELVYGVMDDLGVLEAESPEHVVEILRSRFATLHPDLESFGATGVRAMPAGFFIGNLAEQIFKTAKKFSGGVLDFFLPKPPADEHRDVVECFRTARWRVRWSGAITCCFDVGCARVVARSAFNVADTAIAIKDQVLLLGVSKTIAAVMCYAVAAAVAGAIVGLALGSATRLPGVKGACLYFQIAFFPSVSVYPWW